MNPHLRQAVVTVGSQRARLTAIVLHGRGRTPLDEDLPARIGLPEIAYLAPAAADQTWYPASFLAPFADNEPRLTFALERIDTLIASVTQPVVLIGFSQGACLACEHVYRRRSVSALIAFTGGLLGPPGTTWDDRRFDGLRVSITGSLEDRWVPHARMVETADVLERAGARVTTRFHAGAGHAVTDDEIATASALLASL